MSPTIRLWILPLLLCVMLTACTKKDTPPPNASEVLTLMRTVMIETAQPLPEGLIYTRTASPESPDYLTDTLLSALYGEAARGLLEGGQNQDGIPAVGDAAMYLSVAPYPCELAVFRCSDTRTASTVAGICRSRLDTVSRGYVGSEWQPIAEDGRVTVEGCYVFLVIAEDAATVSERACRRVR